MMTLGLACLEPLGAHHILLEHTSVFSRRVREEGDLLCLVILELAKGVLACWLAELVTVWEALERLFVRERGWKVFKWMP